MNHEKLRRGYNPEGERRVNHLNPVMDVLEGVAVACEEGLISRGDLNEITNDVISGSIRVDLEKLLI